MLHHLAGALNWARRSDWLSDLAAIGEKVGAASRLLHPTLERSGESASLVTGLAHEAGRCRRRLEIRLARTAVPSTDPRVLCDCAGEMVQLLRLIARFVRFRSCLCLNDVPPEAIELAAVARLGGQLVAESARGLAVSGVCPVGMERADLIKERAEELYSRGVSRDFESSSNPLELIRRKVLYDSLSSVVLGGDRALWALRDASWE